ncbi:hypothetical protein N0V90_008207 [Kalmusia sp. IMI 367209]|nr:hypothetical protein N0V90_008207 [Kalmusia sp. IMI 367209]
MEGSVEGKLAWRKLSASDIPSLVRVADCVHPDLPESEEVFAERFRLFPEGCLALTSEGSNANALFGYAISHPIRKRQPPALNSLLKEIAPDADQYYIHDLAILPELRGQGLAQDCISRLLLVAQPFQTMSLISVYGTGQFWGKYGFAPAEVDKGLRKKLMGYGDDAEYLERENKEYEPRTG